MRMRKLGIAGLGLLAAACGGGGEDAGTTAWAEPAAGGEEVVVSRTASTARPGEIVEVYESRLPTSAPRMDMAAAESEETATSEAPSTALSQADTPAGAATPEEPAGTDTSSAPLAQATTPSEQEASLEQAARDICPADIATLRVRARNISHGAAIVLTARGEADVDRLRDRMRQFALAHSTEHAQQCADPSHAGVVAPTSAQHRIADPASPLLSVHDLRLVEIANGVRLELRYGDEIDRVSVRELRTQVRDDAAALADGVCPLSFQMS